MFAYLYITSQNVSLNNTVEVNFSVEGEKIACSFINSCHLTKM